MTDTEKIIRVNIPPEIQDRISRNELRLTGTQVRDARGRIVCNLKSLNLPTGQAFSPNITVRFEGCTFISSSAIAPDLQRALDATRQTFLSTTLKIDRVLEGQKNDLVASIANFDAHFESLLNQSSLTSEREAFRSGVDSATLLASHLGSYVEDYINSTTIHHSQVSESYQEYRLRKYAPRIARRKFENFSDHQVNFFAYSFLQILNKINILSLCYDNRMFFSYLDNLDGLENKILGALHFAMYEMGDEGDIYQMCYGPGRINQTNSELERYIIRIIKYDKINSLGRLIARSQEATKPAHYDPERLSSINAIIDILEDIENLRLRAQQFDEVELSGLSDLSAVRKLLFKDSD